jgi:cardiolipin synthase
MKSSGKYSTIVIFLLSFILIAPIVSNNTVRASVQPFNRVVESVISAETEHVQENLFKLAAGKFPLASGYQTLTETITLFPGRGGSGPQAISLSDSENLDFEQTGTSNENAQHGKNPGKGKLFFTGPNFQAVTHVIGSHLGIVTRPVTAGKRLFFLVYDTLKDTIGWPAISVKANRTILEMPVSQTMDLEAWERRLDEMTGSKTSYGSLNFLVDGEEFFPRFFEAVEDARRSIHIRTYIFDNDDFAINVADTLKNRSEEVDVRVLMDGLGTIMATAVLPDTQPSNHEPPGSVRDYLTKDSSVRVRQKSNLWFTGDHSKTVIVDNEKAFIGGMNFGREYRYEWHDLMVEVNGPVVGDIAGDFGKAWAGGGLLGDIESFFYSLKTRKKTNSHQGYPVRLLFTRPGDSEIRNTQLEAIRRSASYIYLENPYITDDRVLNELVKASRRGVKVKVVLPDDAESEVMNRSNALAANRMLRNGIKVYLLPRMSHVKAAIYDGWACFGSANFDKLSFRVNYEVNLATSHQPVVKELINSLFIPDIRASHELKEELPVRAGDFLLELVADQL